MRTEMVTAVLRILWQMYSKQKAVEAASGRDVKPDMERMREWFKATLAGKTSDRDRRELFGADPPARGSYACPRCEDKGWFPSEATSFEVLGPGGGRRIVQVPGMRVCSCPNGGKKNKAIAVHGWDQKKGRRGTL